MIDYTSIIKECRKNSDISGSVVDEFLLYYAVGFYNLEPEMESRFAKFRHITTQFKPEWINMFKAQYLAHKIFKEGGLINKLLDHSSVRNLRTEEFKYLQFQKEHPWRFSFSIINTVPERNFFIMEDVFTGELFTLYSPGTTEILRAQHVSLWLNLISFNGKCWQSYGPIMAFSSFEPEDIFFFATELDPYIEDDEGLLKNLEANPIPYMMLLSGSAIPPVFHKNDRIIYTLSEYDVNNLDTRILRTGFKSAFNKGVYRFSLKRWDRHPHYCEAYYDENKNILLLTSSTDRGFRALAEEFNKYGYSFPLEPNLRVNPAMVTIASDILKKEIKLNEYQELFSVEEPPEQQETLNKLRKFLNLVMPEINAGRKPDIESMAKMADIDTETALTLLEQVYKSLDNIGGRKRKK